MAISESEIMSAIADMLQRMEADEEPDVHSLIAAYGTTERFVMNDNPVISPDEFDAIAKPIRKLFSDN